MNKLKKFKIAVISFVLAIVMCAGVIPFAGATYTERDKIIDIALNERGYTQKNNYTKYAAEFSSGYGAWCNYFVVWCAKQAGISPEAITGTSSYGGSCYTYLSGLRAKGRFFVNDGSYTPKKGDLVFYNSTRSTSGSTHVGFVLSADENTVTVVEGNVGLNGTRGVAQKVRPRYSYVTNGMVIIGFGVPAYSGEEVPKVKLKKTVNTYPEIKTEKKFTINAEKFETHVTAEERVKLGENFKAVSATPHADFTSIITPTPVTITKVPTECENKFCIYNSGK